MYQRKLNVLLLGICIATWFVALAARAEQQALTIHHKLHNRNYTEPLTVTVCMDTKTKLPLKREITLKQDNRAITLTETYPTLTLDEKVDELRFELPKP